MTTAKAHFPHVADTKHIYESVIGGVYSTENDAPTLEGNRTSVMYNEAEKIFLSEFD